MGYDFLPGPGAPPRAGIPKGRPYKSTYSKVKRFCVCAIAMLLAIATVWVVAFMRIDEVEALRETMTCFHSVATEHDLSYWVDYGSLLGSFRNGKLIPWDLPKDIDLGFFAQDMKRVEAMNDDLAKCGAILLFRDWQSNKIFNGFGFFSLGRAPFRIFWRSRWFPVYLDLGDYIRTPPDILGNCYIHDRVQRDRFPADQARSVHLSRVLPLSECELEGMRLPCPKDVPYHLSVKYGKNFMTPTIGEKGDDTDMMNAKDPAYDDDMPILPEWQNYCWPVDEDGKVVFTEPDSID